MVFSTLTSVRVIVFAATVTHGQYAIFTRHATYCGVSHGYGHTRYQTYGDIHMAIWYLEPRMI